MSKISHLHVEGVERATTAQLLHYVARQWLRDNTGIATTGSHDSHYHQLRDAWHAIAETAFNANEEFGT